MQGPSPAALAVMLHGGLASVLHDLLEDSIDALLSDAGLQRPLLSLLAELCTHAEALPVLSMPAEWPAHLQPPAARREDAGPAGTVPASRACMLLPGVRVCCCHILRPAELRWGSPARLCAAPPARVCRAAVY